VTAEAGSSAIVLRALTRLERLHSGIREYAESLMSKYYLGADVEMGPSIRMYQAGDGIRVDMFHRITFGVEVGAYHEIEIGMRLTLLPSGYEGVMSAGVSLDPPNEDFPGAGTVSHEASATSGDLTEVLDALEAAQSRLRDLDDPFGFLAAYQRSVPPPLAGL
jgi:hypothetical protein